MADQLSTTAQAVLNAAFPTYDDEALYVVNGEQHAGMIAAAALRALAAHGDEVIRTSDILAIAAELERASTP